jgi:heme exporter protein D
MFGTVFRFELAYWFKRPLTLLFFVLFFLMAFFSTASDAFLGIAGGQIHRNAPFVLASAMGILTAIGQVITTAIAGTAVLRDAQTRHRRNAVHDAADEERLPVWEIRRRVRDRCS